MKLLAFESSAKAAGVAVLDDGRLLAEYFQNSGQTHSRTLTKMAEDLLRSCDVPVQALDAACAVPLHIMEKCAEGIVLVERYAVKGSVLAVSDAGCAAALCKAALQAASLNVFINTKLMTDRIRADGLDAQADRLLGEYVPRADAVFASVTQKLRSK